MSMVSGLPPQKIPPQEELWDEVRELRKQNERWQTLEKLRQVGVRTEVDPGASVVWVVTVSDWGETMSDAVYVSTYENQARVVAEILKGDVTRLQLGLFDAGTWLP